MSDLPNFVWVLVLLAVVGIPASACVLLYRGAAVMIGGWLVVSGLLAYAGIYRQEPGETKPWLGLAFLGILAALLAATRIPVVARVLAEPDTPARLALPHTLRVVGVVFLIVMAQGRLPAVFALPAGLGDIAVGLAAPLVAWRLYHGTGHRRAWWFNILGIVDLVIAVTIGFLTGLGPFRPWDVTHSTEVVSLLPLALVATVAVPVAITLHVVSLRRLRVAQSSPDRDHQLLTAAG